MAVKYFAFAIALSLALVFCISCSKSEEEAEAEDSQRGPQVLVIDLDLDHPQSINNYAKIVFSSLDLEMVSVSSSGSWRTENWVACDHPCCDAAATFFRSGGRWTVQVITDVEVRLHLRMPAIDSSFDLSVRRDRVGSAHLYTGEWRLATDCGELRGPVRILLPTP